MHILRPLFALIICLPALNSFALEIYEERESYEKCEIKDATAEEPAYTENALQEEVEQPKPEENKVVFTSVEQMPQFPGGETGLMMHIGSHLIYPPSAVENGIQGRVVVKFVVESDGSIGDVEVVRSKDADLDKEAIRIVKTLPRFIPGRSNGHPVAVWYTIPINFRLQR